MAEAEVKQLKLNRRSAKANFARKVKAVEQLIDNNRSKEEISEVFTQIESAFEKLEKTHEDYARTIEDETEFQQEEYWLVDCQQTFFSLKMKVKDYQNVGTDVNPVDKKTDALCSVILENPRSKSFGSTHQQNDTPTSDLISTSPDVKTAYSKDTCNKSEPKSNKSICNRNDNADNPPHFSMSPVPQEIATEASNENGSSESVVMADTSRRVNDTKVFELQGNPLKFSMSPGPEVEPVDPHNDFSCPHEDRVSYSSCSSSISSSSQARVSVTATGDIPGTTEKNQPETRHVIPCDGDKNMSSKEMSLKRTLSIDPEEQKCCKKRCLRFIGDDLSNECHNMTRKQKEDYVKKYVVVYPNKTKKTTRERNRGFYRKYNLHNDQEVCKTAFCKVLSVCSDFIDKNIDRTQTQNNFISHTAQCIHHQSTTTEAQTQCTEIQDAGPKSKTRNLRAAKVYNIKKSVNESQKVTMSVNLTPKYIHVDQQDQISNRSNGIEATSVPERTSLVQSLKNKTEIKSNNKSDLPTRKSETPNSEYVLANTGTAMRQTNSDRSTFRSPTSNGGHPLPSSGVSTHSSSQMQNVAKTSEQNIESNRKNDSVDHPSSALKNPCQPQEKVEISPLNDEKREKYANEMDPSFTNYTVDTTRCEMIPAEDSQTDAPTKSGRNNSVSLHGHLSDEENQPKSLSKKVQPCCKKRCLEYVSQDTKKYCQNLSKKEKVDYVEKYVNCLPNKIGQTKRERYIYKLQDDTVVCKTAFRKILGVSYNFILKNILRTRTEDTAEEQTHHSDFNNTETEAENTVSVEVKTQSPVTNIQTIPEPVVDQYYQSDSHNMSKDETSKTLEQMSLVSSSDNKTENKHDKKSLSDWQTIQSKTNENPIPTENKTSENVTQNEQNITDVSVKTSDSDFYDKASSGTTTGQTGQPVLLPDCVSDQNMNGVQIHNNNQVKTFFFIL